MDNTNELQHHGTKGMSWGKRLYQNKDGSLTPLGRLRYGSKQKMAAAKRKATVAAKKKAADEEKQKKEELENKKASVLKSRSAKTLYENADLFTTQELQTAYNRLKLEKDIKSLGPEEVSTGKKIVSGLQTLSKAAASAGTIAENVGKVQKLFESNNDSGDKSNKNDKSDKDNKGNKTDKNNKSDKTNKNNKGDKSNKDDKGNKSDKNNKNNKNNKSDKDVLDMTFEEAVAAGKSIRIEKNWKEIYNEIDSDIGGEINEVITIGREAFKEYNNR